MEINTKRKPITLIETVFDIAYLGTVLISGILLCISAKIGSERWQFGIMALILGLGDSFHLLPRIYAMWTSGTKDYTALLGIGKLIASVSMTIFYVLLWNIGLLHYAGIGTVYMTAVIYALAVLRIVFTLLPQNRWTSKDSPLKWSILRNVPFFVLGMFVMVLFAIGSFGKSDGFSFLWLAILISFACYLPVVLFSGSSRKVGMLMLPKSCAYAAIVLMGFSLAGL